jgi:hypothetical protein
MSGPRRPLQPILIHIRPTPHRETWSLDPSLLWPIGFATLLETRTTKVTRLTPPRLSGRRRPGSGWVSREDCPSRSSVQLQSSNHRPAALVCASIAVNRFSCALRPQPSGPWSQIARPGGGVVIHHGGPPIRLSTAQYCPGPCLSSGMDARSRDDQKGIERWVGAIGDDHARRESAS